MSAKCVNHLTIFFWGYVTQLALLMLPYLIQVVELALFVLQLAPVVQQMDLSAMPVLQGTTKSMDSATLAAQKDTKSA